MHTFCSSLTKFSSTKSVQTRFVVPQKPLIDTFLVIIVIYQLRQFYSHRSDEKIEARFSFSDFHGQKLNRQQEPGLREQITENMINISIFTDRVFSPILIIQTLPFRPLE